MPYYFMRDTPLQALEQLMMSQPGQKPRGGGIYLQKIPRYRDNGSSTSNLYSVQ